MKISVVKAGDFHGVLDIFINLKDLKKVNIYLKGDLNMRKKLMKLMSMILVGCLAFSITVNAEEPLRNMTYEEYQEKAVDVDENALYEFDMSPVYVENNQMASQSQISRKANTENEEIHILDLAGLEHIELSENIDITKKANNVKQFENNQETTSEDLTLEQQDVGEITSVDELTSEESVRTVPIAGLVPIIVNEDSLINGNISTTTLIAFLFNDSDEDGDTIVNRYVGGSAANYIIGEIDGGFVVNVTDPGTYELLYQVEDSNGELSEVIGFTFTVVQEGYQVFEGNFTSADESQTYDFSIDFTQMDSAAVCLVRKGYVGTSIQVFDEDGNRVVYRGTQMGQPKNWQFIDKPSEDAGICNYTMVVTPLASEFGNGANDYRIIIGDKEDTELMMSGIENTVLLEHYREGQSRLENAQYIPNQGEYWYKFRANNETITILSGASNIRFKIKSINNTDVDLFDSINDADTHRTSFTGSWSCAEKARLTTTPGTEYYLVVYCTSPNENISIREGSMGTAVGFPVMGYSHTTIYPGRSVTMNSTGFSSISFSVAEGFNNARTGQVDSVSLGGITMSNVQTWRVLAPQKSSWVSSASFNPSIDMNYRENVTTNASLIGDWQASFKASSSAKTKTFTPYFSISYYYEYGD